MLLAGYYFEIWGCLFYSVNIVKLKLKVTCQIQKMWLSHLEHNFKTWYLGNLQRLPQGEIWKNFDIRFWGWPELATIWPKSKIHVRDSNDQMITGDLILRNNCDQYHLTEWQIKIGRNWPWLARNYGKLSIVWTLMWSVNPDPVIFNLTFGYVLQMHAKYTQLTCLAWPGNALIVNCLSFWSIFPICPWVQIHPHLTRHPHSGHQGLYT